MCLSFIQKGWGGGENSVTKGQFPLVILATYNISDESRTIGFTSKWLNLRECKFSGGMPPDYASKKYSLT